jgi:PAS domain S-box-containing protein
MYDPSVPAPSTDPASPNGGLPGTEASAGMAHDPAACDASPCAIPSTGPVSPEDDARARLAAIVESSDDAIIGKTLDAMITSWNGGAERLYGYTAEEAVGRSIALIVPADRTEELPAILQRIRDGQRVDPFETTRVRKDGTPIEVRVRVSPIRDSRGALVGAASIAREVGTVRRLQESLHQTDERWYATLRSIADAVITADAQGCVTFMNPVAERLTGWNQDEAGGRQCEEIYRILDEETRSAAENPVERILREGRVVGLANHTLLIARAGTEHLIDYSGAPIRDRAGNVAGVVLIFRDAAERREAENTLRDSEEQIRKAHAEVASLLKHAPIGLAFFDREGRFLSINARMAQIDGLPVEAHVGCRMRDVLPGLAEALAPILECVFGTGKAVSDVEIAVKVPLTPGDRRHWLSTCFPVFDADEVVVAVGAATMEITDRVRAEHSVTELNARLQRAMAETHHRVKNNLQVISALIEMLADAYDTSVPIAQVRGLGLRVNGLAAIHDLLTERSRAGRSVDRISTRAAVDKLLPLMRSTAGSRSVRASIAEIEVPTRQAGAIVLTVNELVSNALKLGARDVEISLTVVGETACLQVEDNGPGFPSGFDPAVDAHTGLELVMNLTAIDLRGSAEFTNRPEGGGRVAVSFPVSA